MEIDRKKKKRNAKIILEKENNVQAGSSRRTEEIQEKSGKKTGVLINSGLRQTKTGSQRIQVSK